MAIGSMEELMDDDQHAIVSTSMGSEHYVHILSFVDKVSMSFHQSHPHALYKRPAHLLWRIDTKKHIYVELCRWVGPARARLHSAPEPQGARSSGRAAGRHGPDGERDEAREGATGDVRRHRRPRPADPRDQSVRASRALLLRLSSRITLSYCLTQLSHDDVCARCRRQWSCHSRTPSSTRRWASSRRKASSSTALPEPVSLCNLCRLYSYRTLLVELPLFLWQIRSFCCRQDPPCESSSEPDFCHLLARRRLRTHSEISRAYTSLCHLCSYSH